MQNRIHKSIVSIMFALAALGLGRISSASAADAPAAPYVLRGDLSEIKSKGFIRFLVHGEADYLPRKGDPRAAERALAKEFAIRLGLKAIFVWVEEQDDLISKIKGHGDVIVGSFAITGDRSKQIGFSRPIRFIDQLVIVRVTDTSIQQLADLAGQEVTVREGSSYAEALRGAKVKDIRIKPAPGTIQTFDLMQKVGRGEEKVTVADSDLFAASTEFTPNIRAAFKLVEKQPIAWGVRR